MGRTRSRATPDSQRNEKAEICEEITCDGNKQIEKREEKLEAEELNCECETGSGELYRGVTRNINSHSRTETEWSSKNVSMNDYICEKIYYTTADGRQFHDMGDIDSESCVQTNWSEQGFQLKRTLKKVEHFKTNCGTPQELNPTPSSRDTTLTPDCPGPSKLTLKSPVCDLGDLKHTPNNFPRSKYFNSDTDLQLSAYRFPMGRTILHVASLFHVRRIHVSSRSSAGFATAGNAISLCRYPAKGNLMICSSSYSFARIFLNLLRLYSK